MLYIRSPEFIHFHNWKFVPFDQYLPISPAPCNHLSMFLWIKKMQQNLNSWESQNGSIGWRSGSVTAVTLVTAVARVQSVAWELLEAMGMPKN